MTCTKSQEFLDAVGIIPRRTQDARKETIDGAHALTVLDGVEEIFVTKGKTVSRIDLRGDRPSDDALRALVVGPTGNLRAPSARVGRSLVVGFEPATWRALLQLPAQP